MVVDTAGPLTRPSVMLFLIIVGTIAGMFISGGIWDILQTIEEMNPYLRVGIGLIVGLVGFTVVERHAARITVPVILVLAVACIIIGILTSGT